MKLSGQFHAPTASTPRERSIEHSMGATAELCRGEGEKILLMLGVEPQFQDYPTCNIVTL